MTVDPAVQAATDALTRLFRLGPENLSEHPSNDELIATVAVEAARPIIAAEALANLDPTPTFENTPVSECRARAAVRTEPEQ